MRAMEIHRRVLGHVALLGRGGEIAGIDFDLLTQRLLFLDCFVLRTVRLKDIGHLVRAIGADQAVQFLKSGLIELSCEAFQPAAVADERFLSLPKPTFELVWIDNHDYFDDYVDGCLSALKEDLGLWGHDWYPLEQAIRSKITRLSRAAKQEIAGSFASSLDRYQSVLIETARVAAKKRRIPFVLPEFRVQVSKNK